MTWDPSCGGDHAIHIRSFLPCCTQEAMPSVVQWLPCWFSCESADSLTAKRGNLSGGALVGGDKSGCVEMSCSWSRRWARILSIIFWSFKQEMTKRYNPNYLHVWRYKQIGAKVALCIGAAYSRIKKPALGGLKDIQWDPGFMPLPEEHHR